MDFSGETGNALSRTIPATWNGWAIRCVISDVNGNRYVTEEAKISIGTGLKIIADPSDITVEANSSATWTITASGENLTYQWQYQ